MKLEWKFFEGCRFSRWLNLMIWRMMIIDQAGMREICSRNCLSADARKANITQSMRHVDYDKAFSERDTERLLVWSPLRNDVLPVLKT